MFTGNPPPDYSSWEELIGRIQRFLALRPLLVMTLSVLAGSSSTLIGFLIVLCLLRLCHFRVKRKSRSKQTYSFPNDRTLPFSTRNSISSETKSSNVPSFFLSNENYKDEMPTLTPVIENPEGEEKEPQYASLRIGRNPRDSLPPPPPPMPNV